jgi:quinol-cytochrome oxidoreductase complex cytochrome b subunit
VHIALLHIEGSSNPLGVCADSNLIPFYPYYYLKDLFGLMCFFVVYAYLVFFNPNLLGHPDNYIKANSLVTPTHIVPEWYFLPFYAILRAIPHKAQGVLAMVASLLIYFILPFIYTSKVRGTQFKPIFAFFF